jgi:threonine dehydrogenase-like Zn-dependent dehydrogenase
VGQRIVRDQPKPIPVGGRLDEGIPVRAFLIPGPGVGIVADVDSPTPGADQVIVDVALAGVCGTDVSIFHRDDERTGNTRTPRPLRPGHEWSGRVVDLGAGVPREWLGRRVTGDTMIGCDHCARCADGRHHVCDERFEIGVRGDWPGALAEQLVVPVRSLYELPDEVSDHAGAMVEPGANAYRAVAAAAIRPGYRVLVAGPGTIGLLCALHALAGGAEVHLLGVDAPALELATSLGAHGAWTAETLPALPWDAVINATDDATMPQRAIELVEPGRRVVLIGSGHAPATVDTRMLMGKDVTAVGILGGSAGLAATIAAYASGAVDPTPLVASTIGLEGVAKALSRQASRPGGRPKTLVDPRR